MFCFALPEGAAPARGEDIPAGSGAGLALAWAGWAVAASLAWAGLFSAGLEGAGVTVGWLGLGVTVGCTGAAFLTQRAASSQLPGTTSSVPL